MHKSPEHVFRGFSDSLLASRQLYTEAPSHKLSAMLTEVWRQVVLKKIDFSCRLGFQQEKSMMLLKMQRTVAEFVAGWPVSSSTTHNHWQGAFLNQFDFRSVPVPLHRLHLGTKLVARKCELMWPQWLKSIPSPMNRIYPLLQVSHCGWAVGLDFSNWLSHILDGERDIRNSSLKGKRPSFPQSKKSLHTKCFSDLVTACLLARSVWTASWK